MINLPEDQQELKYEPVPDDLDVIAHVVRFVVRQDTKSDIETLWLEDMAGFQMAADGRGSGNGEVRR